MLEKKEIVKCVLTATVLGLCRYFFSLTAIFLITQFCMDSVHCQIVFLPTLIVTHYVAKNWCCCLINFWV